MALIPIQTHTLSNGLQVVVVNNPLTPTVSVGVLYKVGTADDQPSEVGLSHFVEHLMFKGTEKRPGDTYDKVMVKIGGQHNAMTSYDWTMYVADVSANYLETVFEMEADRMVNLAFKKKEVESERGVVLEERRMRTENNPFGAVQELILRTLNAYHPYGVPPIGYPQHINAYTYESVFAHYKKWYAPNNAVLIVVGPVTFDSVVKLAEKYFGSLVSRPIPERKRVENPVIEKTTQHIVSYNKRNASTRLYYFHPGTAYRIDPKLSDALAVVAQMLGNHSVSEVYQEFIEDKKLCLSLTASFDSDSLDVTPFTVAAILGPDHDVEAFRKAWAQYWKNLREKGAKQEELDKAKKGLLMHMNFLSDDNGEMVLTLTSLACGQTVDDIARTPERIEAVTLEDVNRALAFLGDEATVLVDLYPDKTDSK